jgi:hypothetical protein
VAAPRPREVRARGQGEGIEHGHKPGQAATGT